MYQSVYFYPIGDRYLQLDDTLSTAYGKGNEEKK